MARSIVLNLLGRNNTSGAFRGAARDADRAADSVDRLGSSADGTSGRLSGLGKSSDKAGGRLSALTGTTASMTAGLLAVAPAAGAAAAAAVAGAGAMAAAYGSAAAALGAFGLAVKGQLTGVQSVADAQTKAEDAVTKYGKGSEQAAKAQELYRKELAKLPPATRDTARAFLGLKQDYQKWSDSLAGDTMPIFTRGLNVARGLLPKLTPLVKTAANALSDFMGEIEKGTKSKGFGAFIGRINDAAKKSLPAMLRSAKNVAVGVAGIFDAFLPHAGAMSSGIEGLTAKFAKWGQSLRRSEGFKTFIDYVKTNLPALQTTFGNLVQIVVNLATAFAPMSGLSLELVKGFTAMLAALPPPVMTALATAFVAVTAALRIWIPLQTALNILLSANPVGLVVLAIAGLVAGLVIAYKKSDTFRAIVQGAWRGIQTAVQTAWTQFIRPALLGLGSLMADAGAIWRSVWPKLKGVLDSAVAFFRDTLVPAVVNVAEAFGGIGSKAADAAAKISGVGKGFNSSKEDGNRFLSWATAFGAILGQIFGGFTGAILGAVTGYFWPKLRGSFSGGFSWLKTAAAQFFLWLVRATGAGISSVVRSFVDFTRRIQRALFDGLPPVRASWSGFWNWSLALTRRIAGLIGQAITGLMSAGRRAFSAGVDAMGAAWRRLEGYAKKPVNFMIGTVYNKGIRGLWNKVMGWLHIPGMNLGEISTLAHGGTLNNPAPARPGKTNGPMAIVGEGRKAYPEYVIPTDPRYRGRAQGLWAAAGGDLQMLAEGGVLGGVLGGIKKLAGKVAGVGSAGMALLDGPEKIWDKLAGPILAQATGTGAGPWNAAIGKIPAKMMAVLRTAAMSVVKSFAAGFGGDASGVVAAAKSMLGQGDDRGENNNWLTRAWGMPGAPWCAMFVSEAIKKAGATKKYKGYPTAAVAGYAGAMRHVSSSEGRPGDLGAYRGSGPGGWGHINVIEKRIGGSTYSTIGGNEGPVVKRGTRSSPAILRPMAKGGVLGVWQQENLDPADRRDPFLKALRRAPVRTATYDSGGLLQPGYTLAYNGTGRAEAVVKRGPQLRDQKDSWSNTGQVALDKLLGQLNRSLLGSLSKLTTWFGRLGDTIRKNFSGATEKKMLSWASGLQRSMLAAVSQAQAVASKISQAREYAGQVTDSARDFAGLSGLGSKTSADNILTGLTARSATLTKFAGQVGALRARGIAPGLLQQIIGLGPADGSAVADKLLAASGDTFGKINAAQLGIDKAATGIGRSAADALFDSGKGAARGFLTGLYDQQAQLNRLMDGLAKRLGAGLRGRTPGAGRPQLRDGGTPLRPGRSTYVAAARAVPMMAAAEATTTYGAGREVRVVFEEGAIQVNDRADVDMLIDRLEFRLRTATL